MATSEKFIQWLLEELNQRGWSQADLARRSRITPTQISRILSGSRNPGTEALTAIAGALNVPAAMLFQLAGVLPPESASPPDLDEWVHLYKSLPKDDREELIQLARMKVERRKKR